MKEKLEFYNRRIKEKEDELKGINGRYNLVSALRFVDCIVLIVFAANYFFGSSFKMVSVVFVIVAIIIFFALIKWHNIVEAERTSVENSINLNSDDIKRSSGEWKEFLDTGEEYLDGEHKFASDLDVFGKKSFFQWVNATRTIYGREKLRDRLVFKDGLSKNEIYKTQDALKELALKFEFREKFLSALGKEDFSDKNKEKKHFILEWAKTDNSSFLSTGITILRFVAPIITLSALVFAFLGMVDVVTFLSLLAVNYIIVKRVSREAESGINLFEELKGDLSGYVVALKLLENETFNSEKLKAIQSRVINKGKASQELESLYGIGSWINDRHNAFYIILNAALYFDYHLLARAEKWKIKNKEHINDWMMAIGEFEALESLSVVSGNEYVMPVINDDLILEAEEIVHPMLLEEGVKNSFRLDKSKRVALITGSNMSGKSTFLRSIGFSMFLSYLGLGVKAKSFKTPIVSIYTCMRTADNLNENISSFYAEIKRVKKIVDGAKNNERIIFLLDEIFKGTNSIDRHEGAEVLINQLLEGESIGLVSTHDLELCDMEKEDNFVVNYNFREYYENDKLKFDYKLRDGVSKTRNARYLMRMAGIEIE
ncbi:MutS family DNA mismatch repair protein [uncultured Clostridium sp.]|uniref:MutS family DNA mismatch repair protein n=1 Tax=uncultured Clostridium sp. TaxID=59620 RepID=UPI002613F758|nr:MutS family DNA mismatch repair protein [uncultured Clostridium sp.]